MALFNTENTAHKTGEYPLFLGQPMALYDSVTQVFPQGFELYKKQKQQDWSEDEFDFTQSRQDFKTCSSSVSDIMLQTLMWQWEADSVASQAIILLFAPFITNSELFAMMMKQSEIEVLHALTYSEIVRNCNAAPRSVIDDIMNNHEVLERSGVIVQYMRELEVLGAQYRLDKESVDLEQARRAILKALFALIGLEGIEFMSSFACTFALAEQGYFLGIAQAVQKIMIDENLHTQMDFAVLKHLFKDPVWLNSFLSIKDEIKLIFDEVIEKEIRWSEYIFSEGRSIIGLNTQLLVDWTLWNAVPIYEEFGIPCDYKRPTNNPTPWMDIWMYPGKQQNANQEQTSGDYQLNATVNDIADMEFEM